MKFDIRMISAVTASAFALVALTACSDGEPAEAPSSVSEQSEQVQTTASLEPVADGVLQVCLTGDYRPFSYAESDDAELSGIDVEMVKALAAELSDQTGSEVTVEFVRTSWKDLMSTFLSSCDIAVGGITVTPEREQEAAFSIPVIHGGKAAITRCGNESEFDTVDEINQPDTTVITPIGGTNEKFADENFGDAEIIRFSDNNSIFDEIVAGRADVMVSDAPEVVWAAHEHPELCQVNADDPFNSQVLAYLLPKEDAEFQRVVNDWLSDAFTDGTWDAATEEWFGEGSVFAGENRPHE